MKDDSAPTGEPTASDAGQILRHAAIVAKLKLPQAKSVYPQSALLAAFQIKLERLGTVQGEMQSGIMVEKAAILEEVDGALDVAQYGEDEKPSDLNRARINASLPLLARAVLSIAKEHSAELLTETIEKIDGRLSKSPKGIGYLSFRRAYAEAAFRHEGNTERAIWRLTTNSEGFVETTPEDAIRDAAESAKVFLHVGAQKNALESLAKVYSESLGCSLPPRKDAQYIFWNECFEHACTQDKANTDQRVADICAFMDGLTKTEGRGSAGRMAFSVLLIAMSGNLATAMAVMVRFDETGLLSWPHIVAAVTLGIAHRKPALVLTCAIVFGRVGLPFAYDGEGEIWKKLIELAPSDEAQALVELATYFVELEGSASARLPMLEEIRDAAKAKGLSIQESIAERWRNEHDPTESAGTGKSFDHIETLQALEKEIANGLDSSDWYAIARAFERLSPSSQFEAIKEFYDANSQITNEPRAITAVGLAAAKAEKMADAQEAASKLEKMSHQYGAWGQWESGGIKLRYHKLQIAIEGEPARKRAFERFISDLGRNKENISLSLPDLTDIFDVVAPDLSWSNAWTALSKQLKQFRESAWGRPLVAEVAPLSEVDVLAKVLLTGFHLRAGTITRQTRLAVREIILANAGSECGFSLIEKLLIEGGEYALEALRIVYDLRHRLEVRGRYSERLPEWFQVDDLAVQFIATRLANAWTINLEKPVKELPTFYGLGMPDDPQAAKFEKPSGFGSTSTGLWTESPYDWTWTLDMPLGILARGSRFSMTQLRRRVAQQMAKMGGTDRFGPAAMKAQTKHLDRLDLKIPYERLYISDAFLALRTVAAELADANEFDPDRVAMLLYEAGTAATLTLETKPTSRPDGYQPALLPKSRGAGFSKEWIERANSDAVPQELSDWKIIESDNRCGSLRQNVFS